MCSKNFCVQAKGGHRPVPPPPKYATMVEDSVSEDESECLVQYLNICCTARNKHNIPNSKNFDTTNINNTVHLPSTVKTFLSKQSYSDIILVLVLLLTSSS